MAESKIKYNPSLSVKENALLNGVSEAGIRYYIKVNHLDRRSERTKQNIEECKSCWEKLNKKKRRSKNQKKQVPVTKMEIHKKTGHSLSFIRLYWEYIIGDKVWSESDSNKAKKHADKKQSDAEKHKLYLDNLSIDFIRSYLQERESRIEETPSYMPTRYEVVEILDGIKFKPFEKFNIPVADCIQFHSKALLENRVMSNHYDCIIRFRDCEFFSLEQLFLGLTYSHNKKIMREIMESESGAKAKKLCHEKYDGLRDWDFDEKQYRLIALCHLYKYLSVKEYRDRLRETYPQILVECPNGKDYSFGLVQNLESNIFEGNNCSGRTTMIVRDMMLNLENEAIAKREHELGRNLNEEEKEAVIVEVCETVRRKYDASPIVLKDSRRLFKFIEKANIPKIKTRRPKALKAPAIDKTHRCLVLDFDMTIFDTSADDAYRKCSGKKNMAKAFEMIPQYKLYDGWREVFDWCRNNRTKIGIISGASSKLIKETLKHFEIPYDYVVGYNKYYQKPNPILANMLMNSLRVREEQIVYVGDSLEDDIQARCSKFLFYGSTWNNPDKEPFTAKGIQTISHPTDIIKILENISIEEPLEV